MIACSISTATNSTADIRDFTDAGFENPSFNFINEHNNHQQQQTYIQEQNYEIVVLRCKDESVVHNQENIVAGENVIKSPIKKEKLQRFSSFRSSSLSPGMAYQNSSINNYGSSNEEFVQYDDEEMSSGMIRNNKPVITPRPASLSGLFYFCFDFFFVVFLKI